jgi:SnoaL-like domain
MKGAELVGLASELVEAFNAADWPRFRATLSDDVTYEEAGTGRRVDGADDYVRLCQGWKEAFPDVSGRCELPWRVATPLLKKSNGWERIPGRWPRPGARFRHRARASRSPPPCGMPSPTARFAPFAITWM